MAVTWQEVQTTLGHSIPTTEQRDQVSLWIAQARTIIAARLGALDALDQAILDMVVTEAVANRVKRPDAFRKVSVQVDDASVSREYESSAGQIEILPEWWALLSPTHTRAFSIRPYREGPDAG